MRQVRIAAPSRCESRGRYLLLIINELSYFIIKGTTERLFHPLNRPLSQKRVEHLTMPSLSDYLRTPIRL